jgi:hypothetical protein
MVLQKEKKKNAADERIELFISQLYWYQDCIVSNGTVICEYEL